MKKNVFAVTAFMTMIALVFTICENTEAKVRMSRKTLTIEVSKTYTLKLKGVKRKITWKSSKPSIAKVNKKGKVTALRKGKAIVTAKAGKKIFKCVVIVQDKKNTEVLNIATPKPDEPTAMPQNPAAAAGQPTLPPDLSTPPVRTPETTSGPDQSTAEPQQPTSTPDLSTPTPPVSTPEPTSEPTSAPTTEPTPGLTPDDLVPVGPTVLEFAAYMDCRISDIEKNCFKISDANGAVICGFDWPEVIVYDGIITKGDTGIPFNSDDKYGNYAIKGENISYSDIRIGDVVDVVYCYGLDHPEVEKRVYFCDAINVHKREE